MTNPRIKQLQTRLSSLGFNPGRVDGRYGDMTHQENMKALDRVNSIPQALEPFPNQSPIDTPILKSAGDYQYAIDLSYTDRKINELVIHCSATKEGQEYTVDDIERWHKQRGWREIGYHYVVHLDGTIIETYRKPGEVGAHVRGRNRSTLGVCYIGGLDSYGRPRDTRTPAQRAAMRWLAIALAEKHRLKIISGHNQYAAKACPCFDVPTDELGNIPGFHRGKRKWIGS